MKIIGHKQEMTQVFGDDGRVFPVTIIKLKEAAEVEKFAEGGKITASGISKGKGFQGVVKRHGFHGGPRSHGQKHSEREPGAIGGGGGRAGGRVAKGIRMAGRMGNDRVTLKKVTVVKLDAERGMLYLSGAIPGRRGSLVEISAE
jgi:large subunit ribosomal protein L3